LGGFAQFAGNTTHLSRPSTPSSVDESPVDLEPELVVIIKKVSKRDAVTKIKALEELEAYLKSNEGSLKPILPKWVKQREQVNNKIFIAFAL
jgi:2-keto-4-pentenoate hydratase/2-oxohepta-3-ene-1,7-dioic acid hydratase in catechol pathway